MNDVLQKKGNFQSSGWFVNTPRKESQGKAKKTQPFISEERNSKQGLEMLV